MVFRILRIIETPLTRTEMESDIMEIRVEKIGQSRIQEG